MSRVFAGVLIALVGCHLPGAPDDGGSYDRTTVDLTAVTPTLAGGGVTIFAAAGKTYVGSKISRDGGATWEDTNTAVLMSSMQAVDESNFVVDTTAFGLGRWTMSDNMIRSANAPGPAGVFRVVPGNGTIISFNGSVNGAISRGTMANQWSTVTLTKPPASNQAFLSGVDIAASRTTIMFVSSWGVYRSTSDGQSWDLVQDVPVSPTDLLTQIVAMDDGRFIAFAGNRTGKIFDASGMPTGQVTPVFPHEVSTNSTNVHKSACLGGIIDGDMVTTDLGQTFQPLIPAGPYHVLQSACGVGDPAQLIATDVHMGQEQVGPFYTTKMTALGKFGAILPIVPSTAAAANFHLSPSGTVFANDQSWKPGDAGWSLAPLNDGTFFLRDGSLLYLTATDVMRSTDDGASYVKTSRVTMNLTFTSVVQDKSGTLYGSVMASANLQWLYTSIDLGVTWTQVVQAPVTPPAMPDPTKPYIGQPLTLLRVVDDGTLVAKAGTAIAFASDDGGVTWRGALFPSGFSYYDVTPSGLGITFEREDTEPGMTSNQGAWHLWDDHGVGFAIEQITPQMTGMPVNIGDAGGNIAVDKNNYVYLTGGGVPLVFKTDKPFSD
ncbi:MAG TPA: sialidase family protein [Kofleriaceae bacterium]|jgi:hypothetical protein